MKNIPLYRPSLLRRISFLLAGLLCVGASALAQPAPRPARPVMRAPLSIMPGLLVVQDINYTGGASAATLLDVYYPAEIRAGKPHPLIVLIHGGGWANGSRNEPIFVGLALEWAQRGYVVASIDYRLSREAPFPAAVEDCKTAVRWLKTYADEFKLDPKRVAVWGHSAGAHLATLVAVAPRTAGLEGSLFPNEDSTVQAAVAVAGNFDFFLTPNAGLERPGMFLAGTPETREARLKAASPITYVSKETPPFLLIHGTRDGVVNVVQSDTFAAALRAAGVPVDYQRIEGAKHDAHREQTVLLRPIVNAFFDRWLKPAGE
jgi:acetyl esterase/lipase